MTEFLQNHELDKPSTLQFTVIGGGQVVDKYWLRSAQEGLVKIEDIISLEPEATFRETHPNLAINYYQTRSDEETITRLIETGATNVAIATPTAARLSLTRSILTNPKLAHIRLFIEKPFAGNYNELAEFEDLIVQHSDRVHLAGKYAQGRADIFFQQLPQDRLPDRITARLIEGSDYYKVVRERVEKEGTHPYIIDGPELDLGFQLLDVIGVWAQRIGEYDGFEIVSIADASQTETSIEPGYAFTGVVNLRTRSGKVIPIDIQAGKVDGSNNRSMTFHYTSPGAELNVMQEYTAGVAIDPVYVNGIRVTQHPSDYNYYARELQPDMFAHQNRGEQQVGIEATKISLDMKWRREEQTRLDKQYEILRRLSHTSSLFNLQTI